jgi:UDP-hydrolysing UDP-N-acetyl-D-glucosamine 2-epimerase
MPASKRLIAVFSGNRAEYGLLYPILRAIREHSGLDYRLIISGAHLDSDFGQTKSEIRKDGFEIHAEVDLDMSGEGSSVTSQAIASGILGMSSVLHDLNPDVVVVYADRFEGFSAMIAATQMNIPSAHIEGGDITEGGALDDSVRHAMTKLAHLHYTSNSQASNRVLAMGEDPWRVKTVGFTAIDLIMEGNFASAEELCQLLGLEHSRPVILFTQHSVTTEFKEAVQQLRSSMESLSRIANEDAQVILTYPNNDVGGKDIVATLKEFTSEAQPNIQLHKSLGRYNYHGILALARSREWRIVCVGNSSSGIKETSVFGCPTVNIGSRQQGRLRSENVLDANYNAHEIYSAIQRCLYDEEFRARCAAASNPYGGGTAGQQVADNLASVDLSQNVILRKCMTLTGESRNGWFR